MSRIILLLLLIQTTFIHAQTSVSRDWNNMVLEGIRNDYARPTVHARNLFHNAIIAYDAWAAYDPSKDTYLLGDTLHGYICNFNGVDIPADIQKAREEAISYASYRFIINRYQNSPDYNNTLTLITNYMLSHGYDIYNTSTDYVNGGPAELGNYLAEQIELYGLTDGSNEAGGYQNLFYQQMNPPLVMADAGNPDIQDPNHWQPLTLTVAIDQSGNMVTGTQPHLSPEWGEVNPFSLDTTMYAVKTRDGMTFKVYFDTVAPTYITGDSTDWDSFYKWNHTLVSVWQSHLDTADNVMWDISPASTGNNTWYPLDSSQYSSFYDLLNGGDPGSGYALNPVTGLPYTPQIVHRGDYARVLAEFWADGLDSETPPGHWFEIYHYVEDQPLFVRKWQGVGPVLDTLEFDVKTHLALGGAMHDAAIASWSLKGYYDFIRPVSAIRYMADQGQSSDTSLANYNVNGIPLLPGLVEVVMPGDTLAGNWNENVGKIKLYTWKGHDYINDPAIDQAGVGWILAEHWWPYQRPTFVTPPFAGFVSGHSTFSRAGAEMLTAITGSEYFPGGMGEFLAPQNEYLQFEEGPSDTIVLQWAKYKDASDQCSLSRIWGGIHPPVDDMQGRFIGEKVGGYAFAKADSIFSISFPALIAASCSDSIINIADIGNQFSMQFTFNVPMDTSVLPTISFQPVILTTAIAVGQINWLDSFNCEVIYEVLPSSEEIYDTKIELDNLLTGTGMPLSVYSFDNFFIVDTKKPTVVSWNNNISVVTDAAVGQQMQLELYFSEPCDIMTAPTILLTSPSLVNPTFTTLPALCGWANDTSYHAVYSIQDFNETIDDIVVKSIDVSDVYGNPMDTMSNSSLIYVDTENPSIVSVVASDTLLSQADLASPQFNAMITFSEAMDTSNIPVLNYYDQGVIYSTVSQNISASSWMDSATLDAHFILFAANNDLISLDLIGSMISDEKGNMLSDSVMVDVIDSDMKSPEVLSVTANRPVIADSVLGSGLYYVDVVFSEEMDGQVVPLVKHEAVQTLTNSLQYDFPISLFLDSVTYRAYYQVLDENIEVADIDLKVQYGKDVSGNPQAVYVDSSFIWLDTKNPSVIGLYANDYVLDQIGAPFNVVSVFDEPMYSSQTPALLFNPLVSAPVDLTLMNSQWLNSSTYEFDYQLVSGSSQTEVYEVTVGAAVDLAGNLIIPLGISDFLTINPSLGLNELTANEIVLYPTIITTGNTFYLLDKKANEKEVSYDMVDVAGRNSQVLSFKWDGKRYISNAVHAEPGVYYVSNGSNVFKILVVE